MEYVGFVLGIFGLVAFLESASLKKRVDELERELGRIQGTSFAESKTSLKKAIQAYIGQNVILDMKEDHEDVDIYNYGNTKHGSVTVEDADEDWLLIRLESPKGTKRKLIRLESVDKITLKQ